MIDPSVADTDEQTGRGSDAPPGSFSTFDADVILLHGFFGAPWTMRLMGRTLRRDGFQPFCPWYESWASPFDAIVDRLYAALRSRAFGQQRPVHFVGHSMGGLIARALAERLAPPMMGRMVMIGTPNSGSEIADFCTRQQLLRPLLGRAGPTLVTTRALPSLDDLDAPAYPVGIIAGNRPLPSALRILPPPHDGRVSIAATHFEGEADHITLPVSHSAMPYNGAVQRQTQHFLKQGQFNH